MIHVPFKWPPIVTMYDVIIYPDEYTKDNYSPHLKLLNVGYNYFWCCAISIITVFSVDRLGTY